MGFTLFGRVTLGFQRSGMCGCHSWASHHMRLRLGNSLEHPRRLSAPMEGRGSFLSAPRSAGDGLQQPAPGTAWAVNHPLCATECVASAGSVPPKSKAPSASLGLLLVLFWCWK